MSLPVIHLFCNRRSSSRLLGGSFAGSQLEWADLKFFWSFQDSIVRAIRKLFSLFCRRRLNLVVIRRSPSTNFMMNNLGLRLNLSRPSTDVNGKNFFSSKLKQHTKRENEFSFARFTSSTVAFLWFFSPLFSSLRFIIIAFNAENLTIVWSEFQFS